MVDERYVMVNDEISSVLEDFEIESSDLWITIDEMNLYEDYSYNAQDLVDYLDENGYDSLALMDDIDSGTFVVLSIHRSTQLAAIDIETNGVHLYKIFGDIRNKDPYDMNNPEGKSNIYRAFADICIWMNAASNNEGEYRVEHCKNLFYKLI